jgi:hypothetical protein
LIDPETELGFDYFFGSQKGTLNVKPSNPIRICLVAAVIAWSLFGISAVVAMAAEVEIPVLNAQLGKCSVNFTVRDPENNPLYNAKIRTDLSHGFLRLRHISLEVSTNSDGKAKIIGLPSSPKKAFEFRIISGKYYIKANSFPSSKCDEDKIDITFGPQDLLKTD